LFALSTQMKTFLEQHILPIKHKLYRMVYLWVKDKDNADDILQNVFEKAWRRKEEIEQMENPIGWVVRTLKNECLMHLRVLSKKIPLEALELEELVVEEDQQQPDLKPIFDFLKTLPLKQQEVFVLREVEGLTYEEISDYLEISMEQVKVNLYRVRQAIKKYLEQKKHDGY
jgi:RNA polymerase sigma factor (sigma-70 family)